MASSYRCQDAVVQPVNASSYQPEFWSDDVLDQAVAWHLELIADPPSVESSGADLSGREKQAAWQAWYASGSEQQQAWDQLMQLNGSLDQLDVSGRQALYQTETRSNDRRTAMKTMLAVALCLPAGLWGFRQYQNHAGIILSSGVDYVTRTGEFLPVRLSDGTQLSLNTDTRVRVYSDRQYRLVELIQGEIMIKTSGAAHAGRVANVGGTEGTKSRGIIRNAESTGITGKAKDKRPFSVITTEGEIRALGTEFLVRKREDIHVALFDGQVAVMPLGHTGYVSDQARASESDKASVSAAPENDSRITRLKPGEGVTFNRYQTGPVQSVSQTMSTWQQGMLVVQNWTLERFCMELSRYLTGRVYCRASVASLRLSGSFPLNPPEKLLSDLPDVLPVSVYSVAGLIWVLGPA